MALSIDQKKQVVNEVSEVASSALSAVAAEYRGLSVEQLSSLRAKAREMDVYVKVVKNTLAKKAIKNTSFECMEDSLKGPIILAFSKESPGAAAKLLNDFSKDNSMLKPISLSVNGELLEITSIEKIAKLPTKDEAISILMSLMKMPIEKFVRTLAAPNTKLVFTLHAYKNTLEKT
ncbi:MAG: 50S ribosomal protein L10 [Pseudomonadota bacterium]|nr:50S ribosomal protein L10 [Pseudomonadota bacterium]